jgi:putative ABC transport system ATP-binding protein
MIALENVSKIYGSSQVPVYALRDVSLSVAEGEFVAVMGPSGSGKSTLLSVLGAMNSPSEGRVVVDGIDVYHLKAEQQADFRHEYIGFVFQQLQLLPYLTAQENVMLTLAIARHSKAEKVARAREALDQVGLKGKEARLPYQLSGGEQGRVAVARAMVNRPPMLLADEPTGNLDRQTGTQVLELLRELNREGQTVIMVTHDPAAAQYAGRTVQILDGQIAGSEPALERSEGPAMAGDRP